MAGGIINLGDGDDHYPGVLDDNSGAETIFAMNGSDTVLAGIGNDTVYGGNGDDELFGESGDDYLEGADGNDRIEGGDGNDIITDSQGVHTSIDAGDGNDYVQLGSGFGELSVVNGGAGSDILQSSTTALDLLFFSGFEGLETFGLTMQATAEQFESFDFIRSSGEDPFALVTLQLYGLAGIRYGLNLAAELGNVPVILLGSWGDDRLTTGNGNDQLWGDLGNDRLYGGRGRDDLHGSAGKDRLFGGAGRDTQTGGGGADLFVYQDKTDSDIAGGKSDWIVDFGHGPDRIDLSALGPLEFIGTDAFDGAGQVRYDIAGGVTTVLVRFGAGGGADMAIRLDGEHVLTGLEFVL